MNETGFTFIDGGKIEGVVVTRPRRYADERGWVMEFFRNDELDAGLHPVMGYLSVTNSGVKRGPHEHREQADYFVFPGPGDFLVALWDNRPESPTYRNRVVITAGESDICTIVVPAGVVHGYCCISSHAAVSINVPNRLYKGEGKQEAVDEIRHENLTASRFARDFDRILAERPR